MSGHQAGSTGIGLPSRSSLDNLPYHFSQDLGPHRASPHGQACRWSAAASHQDRGRRQATDQHAALRGAARHDPVRRFRRRRATARNPHRCPRAGCLAHDHHRGVRSADLGRPHREPHRLRYVRQCSAQLGSAEAARERGAVARHQGAEAVPGLRDSRRALQRALSASARPARLHDGPAGLRCLSDRAVDSSCGQALARRPQRRDGLRRALRPSASAPGHRRPSAYLPGHHLRSRAGLHRRGSAAGLSPDRLDADRPGRQGLVREPGSDRGVQQPDRVRGRDGAGSRRPGRACGWRTVLRRAPSFASRS